MILFVALIVLSSCLAEDNLRQILRSPKATFQLYSNFKVQEGLKYSGSEDRLRFRLFRSNAEFVADLNEHKDTAIYALNFFSSLTSDERQRYLGLNITGHIAEDIPVGLGAAPLSLPSSKLWTNVGAVTEVKNQGSCGSCWTFGAVGGLETRYQQGSGKLRSFSEQEYLDCVYEGKRDGCQGGWPDDCYSYSRRNGGRLASTANYKYTQKDGACLGRSKPDDMVAMKIEGYISVGRTEAANIEALATGSVAVAFEVTNAFQQYRGGVMRDTTCKGSPNHAVTAVGYTPSFVLVKNSWGNWWGDKGFVKFARNYGNCGLFGYSSYPKLRHTSVKDTTPSDAATPYRPTTDDDVNPKPKPACKDKYSRCAKYSCKYTDWAMKWCRKSCNFCDGDDGECPSGTTRCSDGICRHEHMCH